MVTQIQLIPIFIVHGDELRYVEDNEQRVNHIVGVE